jgi:endonuclease/exonuclease/phosphatase family metal-dependent hydrolase
MKEQTRNNVVSIVLFLIVGLTRSPGAAGAIDMACRLWPCSTRNDKQARRAEFESHPIQFIKRGLRMAKIFSVASWNVEHFKGDTADIARIDRVIQFLADTKPDLFALYEVEGSTVFQTLVDRMPGYTFQITEGEQTQEILVGVERNMTAFITQRTEYRSGTTHMRPGQLVTIKANGSEYAVLFLHVASGADPRGMGLRDDMVQRALDFRTALSLQNLRNGGDGGINYMFMGDLNSMGMDYPFGREITAAIELDKWDLGAGKKPPRPRKVDAADRPLLTRMPANPMKRLHKTHPKSWSNGSGSSIPDSDLDHVFATQNLSFRSFTAFDGSPADVQMKGWVEAADKPAKDAWIKAFSDHNLLYLEVHG